MIGRATPDTSRPTVVGESDHIGAERDRVPDLDSLARNLTSLEPCALGRIIAVVGRSQNPFRSSFPSEIVTCTFDDGSVRRVFVKHGLSGQHSGHGYWGGMEYEGRIYKDVLSVMDVGAAAYIGAWRDDGSGQTSLAVEYLEARRLNKSPTACMTDASRWIAGFHLQAKAAALRYREIPSYDEAFYVGWSQRALAFVRLARPECTWMNAVVRHFEERIPDLTAAEQVFIHGEFYPENVLVDEGRVCVVDWQSAAMGPGEIDLASLTEGPWPAELVGRWQNEYMKTRWQDDVPAASAAVLHAARLYWHMRWLGDDPTWTASPKRAHYIDGLHAVAIDLGLL